MRRLALIPILFTLFTLAPLAAQDTPPATGWPVEQRCVGDPTPPPAAWTYDGTIFFYNSTGIRGKNFRKYTPYIILNQDFLTGAALSPDGKWYAFPKGHRKPGSAIAEDYVIDIISVYSTTQEALVYEVPWHVIFMDALAPYYDIPTVKWIDNTHLAFTGAKKGERSQIVNPFTGDTKITPVNIDWGTASLSPDLELAVQGDYGGKNWGLYDLQTGDLIRLLGYDENMHYGQWMPILWTPDSSYFFAQLSGLVENQGISLLSLARFNQSGDLDQIVFSIEAQREFDFSISPNGKYIAVNSLNRLFMVDLERGRVLNTCLLIQGHAWSPDGEQLAYSTDGDIVVLDMQSWQQYKLASDQGVVLSWGAAD